MDAILIATPLVLCLSGIFAMLGLGGASIYVPVFIWLGVPIQEAVVSGLFINILTTGVAAFTFQRSGMIGKSEVMVVGWLVLGALIGGPVGAWLSTVLEPKIILGLFSLVLFVAAMRMMFGVKTKNMTDVQESQVGMLNEVSSEVAFTAITRSAAKMAAAETSFAIGRSSASEAAAAILQKSAGTIAAESAAGAGAGIVEGEASAVAGTVAQRTAMGTGTGAVSGTLGIGGGVFLVPFLIESGMRPKKAAVISIMCTFFASIIGIASHFLLVGQNPQYIPNFMAATGIAAATGAFFGSRMMAGGKVGDDLIKKAFIILLLLFSFKLALDFFEIRTFDLWMLD